MTTLLFSLSLLLPGLAEEGQARPGESDDGVTAEAVAATLEEAQLLELTSGDVDKALELYRRVALNPSAPQRLRGRAFLRIAGLERKRGNLRLAVVALKSVLQVAPEDSAERRLAEQVFERLQRGAARTTRRTIGMTPFSPITPYARRCFDS